MSTPSQSSQLSVIRHSFTGLAVAFHVNNEAIPPTAVAIKLRRFIGLVSMMASPISPNIVRKTWYQAGPSYLYRTYRSLALASRSAVYPAYLGFALVLRVVRCIRCRYRPGSSGWSFALTGFHTHSKSIGAAVNVPKCVSPRHTSRTVSSLLIRKWKPQSMI